MSEVLKFCLGFEICDKDFQISKRLRDVKTILEILAGPVNLRKRIRILYFFLFLLLTGEGRKGIKEKYIFFLTSFEVANASICREIEKLTLNSLLEQCFASLLFHQVRTLEMQAHKML